MRFSVCSSGWGYTLFYFIKKDEDKKMEEKQIVKSKRYNIAKIRNGILIAGIICSIISWPIYLATIVRFFQRVIEM